MVGCGAHVAFGTKKWLFMLQPLLLKQSPGVDLTVRWRRATQRVRIGTSVEAVPVCAYKDTTPGIVIVVPFAGILANAALGVGQHCTHHTCTRTKAAAVAPKIQVALRS